MRCWVGPDRRAGGADHLPGRTPAFDPACVIACLLAIAAEYTIVGIVRAQLEVDASLYTRYAYLSGILALIALASLIVMPMIRSRGPAVVAVGAAVVAFSLIWNVTAPPLAAASSTWNGRPHAALVVLGTRIRCRRASHRT